MDDRVQQCPNCGAAVLPSARFCVTCGIRLPESPGEPAHGDARPSGWSQPAEDVWIGEAPALDDESEQRLTDDFQRDEQSAAGVGSPQDDTGGPDGGTSEEAVIALPPAEPDEQLEPTSLEPNGDGEPSAVREAAGEAPDQLAADVGRSSAAEDESSLPTDEPGPDPDAHSGIREEESEVEQVGPEGELTDLVSGTGEADATADASRWPTSTEQASPSPALVHEPGDRSQEPDDFEPAGWDDLDDEAADLSRNEPVAEEANEPVSESTEPDLTYQPVAPASEPASDLDRATVLLQELRDLLPRLAAPAASPESTTDPSPLLERARMARSDNSFDDFAALRDVVSDAVNRPRDIEVVLRLSQRIEDIDALLKERDRLDAALNDLIEGLDQ